jgi:hypothetical protein
VDAEISFAGDGKVILNGETAGFGINLVADPQLRGFTVASGHVPQAPGPRTASLRTH